MSYFSLFLFLISFVFSFNNVIATTATINNITNNTVESLVVKSTGIETIDIAAGGGYSKQLPIPAEDVGFLSISGVGRGEFDFSLGTLVNFPPFNSKGYAWLEEEFTENAVSILFQAKTEKGGIEIAIDSEYSDSPKYVVVIGGENNTASRIIKNGDTKTSINAEENRDAMAGLLPGQDPGAYGQYWVCFDKGLILVGKGDLGDNIFLSWRDADFGKGDDLSVNRVGFGSQNREIKYTNIFLLPALKTFIPNIYETIKPQEVAKEKIELPSFRSSYLQLGGLVKFSNSEGRKLGIGVDGNVEVGQEASGWIIRESFNKPYLDGYSKRITIGDVIRLESLGEPGNYLEYGDSLKKSAKSNDWKITTIKYGQSVLSLELLNSTNNKYALNVINYAPPITNEFLPTGSIISLKSNHSGNYVGIKTMQVGGNLKYGSSIELKNEREIKENDLPPEKKSFSLSWNVSSKVLQKTQTVQGSWGKWEILPYDGSGSGDVLFGSIVVLQNGTNYLSISGDGKFYLSNKKSKAARWEVINPESTLSTKEIPLGSRVAFKSVEQKKYIGGDASDKVFSENFISEYGRWVVTSQGDSATAQQLLFADDKNNNNYKNLFRVTRTDDGWLGLESLAFVKNIAILSGEKDFVGVGKDNFYDSQSVSSQFLIRWVGENNYYLVNRGNGKNISINSTRQPLKLSANGMDETSSFDIEIISKPEIKIINAMYKSVDNPTRILDVTNIVQSLVDGKKLIIPAGRKAKNLIFNDKISGEKELTIVYLDGDKEVTKILKDADALFLELQEEFDKTKVLEVNSGMNKEYLWLSYPFRITGRGSFTFEAKALDDICIGLIADPQNVFGTDKAFYQIVIGAENNSKIILNKKSEGLPLASADASSVVVADGSFQKYWVSVSDGIILVGKGALGQNLLMAYKDRDALLNIKQVGLSCGLKPAIYRNFSFAPPVNLGNPPEMDTEYRTKLKTYQESTRKFKLVVPFEYKFKLRDPQVIIENYWGQSTPVQSAEGKGKDYKFFVDIREDGYPNVALEYEPGAPKTQVALTAISGVLSGVGEGLGGMMSFQAAAAGGAISGAAEAIGAATEAAYSGPEDVRTEEYKQKMLESTTDEQIEENEQFISEIEGILLDYDPESSESDFKNMIELYRQMLISITNPDHINERRKDKIERDLEKLIESYKKYDPKTYNDLISMLMKAYNNPFLFGPKDQIIKENIFVGITQIVRDLFKKVPEVEMEEWYGEYAWLDQELPNAGNGAVIFEAKGARDIFVTFSSKRGSLRDQKEEIPMYEVIIGAVDNSAILFRLSNKGYLIREARIEKTDPRIQDLDAMPSAYEYKKYWLSVETGAKGGERTATLRFGFGAFKKENSLIEWVDNQPPKGIKYIGFSSWGTPYKIKNIKVGGPVGTVRESSLRPVYSGAAQPVEADEGEEESQIAEVVDIPMAEPEYGYYEENGKQYRVQHDDKGYFYIDENDKRQDLSSEDEEREEDNPETEEASEEGSGKGMFDDIDEESEVEEGPEEVAAEGMFDDVDSAYGVYEENGKKYPVYKDDEGFYYTDDSGVRVDLE